MTAIFLRRLPPEVLADLAAAFRRKLLDTSVNSVVLRQIVPQCPSGLGLELKALIEGGFTPETLAVLIDSMAVSREDSIDPTSLFDLVLSGPEAGSAPMADTGAVVHTLIEGAVRRVELVGYAVHNGRQLFRRLAERMARDGLEVIFCLEISRLRGDTSLASELVRRFVGEFFSKHWPGGPKPRIFYDPRSLLIATAERSSLHAKCVIADQRSALVTSANFTTAAQRRNIEAGILIRHTPTVERLCRHFEGLRAAGFLVEAATD